MTTCSQLTSRAESAVKQRLHAAAFPEAETLDPFDFAATEGVTAAQLAELARGAWLARGVDKALTVPHAFHGNLTVSWPAQRMSAAPGSTGGDDAINRPSYPCRAAR